MNAHASENSLIKQVKIIVDKEWEKTLAPKLSSGPSATRIENRLSDPFPKDWPLKNRSLVFYAYARGLNLSQLKGAEYLGPAWAKVIVDPKPILMLINKDIHLSKKTVGSRPLETEETKILDVDPVDLLQNERNLESDQKIKSYYCLQKQLGNIPAEVLKIHVSFIDWLGCK